MHIYKSGFPIRLGPLTLISNLTSAVESAERTGLKMVCPEHKTFVHQELHCDGADHEVERDATLRGQITEDGLRIVNPEEIPKYEASETFDLVPVPADALETHTAPDRSVFYVMPKPKSGADDAWLVFYQLVKDSKVAYVVNGNLRKGRRSLFRLTIFNGYLALRQLKFPAEVRDTPQIPETDSTKTTINQFKKLAKGFSEQAMVAWEKFDSVDSYRETLEQFVAQGELVEAPEGVKKSRSREVEVPSTTDDMMEALRKSLEG